MKSTSAEAGSLAPPPLLAITAQGLPEQAGALSRARAFAEPLLTSETLDTGENILAHADAVAAILKRIGGSEAMQAACYLVYACDHLNKPQDVITKAFGASFANLAMETTKLVRVQRMARLAQNSAAHAGTSAPMAQTAAAQTESVRKMLLAFSRDLRVVMLRLASRLQTLRFFAASKLPVPPGLASESLQVFAPLANRLGIWEIKWELEDLSFRFLEPETYRQIARLLDEKRTERESAMEALRLQLAQDLAAQGIQATVQGRPKHIYSIVKKMRGKSLDFAQVYDVRALRIVVPSVPDCYAALAWVHSHFAPISEEFDDYIARPKANGYQSLHTVVRDRSDRPIEVQLRTQAMHDVAERGVAAHWRYREREGSEGEGERCGGGPPRGGRGRRGGGGGGLGSSSSSSSVPAPRPLCLRLLLLLPLLPLLPLAEPLQLVPAPELPLAEVEDRGELALADRRERDGDVVGGVGGGVACVFFFVLFWRYWRGRKGEGVERALNRFSSISQLLFLSSSSHLWKGEAVGRSRTLQPRGEAR